jgi:hypothetical protein
VLSVRKIGIDLPRAIEPVILHTGSGYGLATLIHIHLQDLRCSKCGSSGLLDIQACSQQHITIASAFETASISSLILHTRHSGFCRRGIHFAWPGRSLKIRRKTLTCCAFHPGTRFSPASPNPSRMPVSCVSSSHKQRVAEVSMR